MGCYFSFFQEVITVLSEYLSDFGIRICFFFTKKPKTLKHILHISIHINRQQVTYTFPLCFSKISLTAPLFKAASQTFFQSFLLHYPTLWDNGKGSPAGGVTFHLESISPFSFFIISDLKYLFLLHHTSSSLISCSLTHFPTMVKVKGENRQMRQSDFP